jgi:hypothetical protein
MKSIAGKALRLHGWGWKEHDGLDKRVKGDSEGLRFLVVFLQLRSLLLLELLLNVP